MKQQELLELKKALQEAEKYAQKYANTEDGGTCNLDNLMVKVNATLSQMKSLGWGCFRWLKRDKQDGRTWFVIGLRLCGQGNCRSRMAEAACEKMEQLGYRASVYSQMD